MLGALQEDADDLGGDVLSREGGPAIAAKSFAGRIVSAAFGTRVREWRTAIAAKLGGFGVFGLATRTAHSPTFRALHLAEVGFVNVLAW
jgi:hypothetical protein